LRGSTVTQHAVAKAGPRHRLILGHKRVERLGQEPHHLALADLHPDAVQQRHKPLRGDLPLGMQGQHEAPRLRPKPARPCGHGRLPCAWKTRFEVFNPIVLSMSHGHFLKWLIDTPILAHKRRWGASTPLHTATYQGNHQSVRRICLL